MTVSSGAGSEGGNRARIRTNIELEAAIRRLGLVRSERLCTDLSDLWHSTFLDSL